MLVRVLSSYVMVCHTWRMTKHTAPASATCTRCGRTLTDPRSIARGAGPVCFRKIKDNALLVIAAFSHEAVRKALELIADGGIVPAGRIHGDRMYLTVSSDGSTRYETTMLACACKAGSFDRPCYHRTAVALLAA